MGFFIGFFSIILSILFPIGGFLFGTFISLFSKKANLLVVGGMSIAFAGFALHYIYLPTDDMFRYVQYMNSIQHIDNVRDFIGQMYSSVPISQYGLNGRSWPLSALLLFDASKQYGYQLIAMLTLVSSVFVRILIILKVTETKGDYRLHHLLIRLTALVVILLVMTIKLPVSGFRWYLATNLILVLVISDLKTGNIGSVWKLGVSVIAALFHPIGWLYLIFRFTAGLFSKQGHTSKKRLFLVVFGALIMIVMLNYSNYVWTLVNQFGYYLSSGNSTEITGWMTKYFYVWFIVLLVFYYKVMVSDNAIPFGNRIYLSLNFVLLAFSLLFFSLFQRTYPFAFPLLLAYWAYDLTNEQVIKASDIIPIVCGLIMLIIFYGLHPNNYFPPLDVPIQEVFWMPIFG